MTKHPRKDRQGKPMKKRFPFFVGAWASILWIFFTAEDPSALVFELFINIRDAIDTIINTLKLNNDLYVEMMGEKANKIINYTLISIFFSIFVVFMIAMVNILHDAFIEHKKKLETTSVDGASEVELAPKTQEKVIKVAAEICRMHAKTAGARECQDWSNTNIDPSKLFTEQEKKDLLYNFEAHNSGGADYDEECLRGVVDEMVMSFVISRNLELMVDHKHNHTEATK